MRIHSVFEAEDERCGILRRRDAVVLRKVEDARAGRRMRLAWTPSSVYIVGE
jgi:hypothetical protein